MTAPAEFVAECRQRGIKLTVKGDTIRATGKPPANPERFAAYLQKQKEELITLLSVGLKEGAEKVRKSPMDSPPVTEAETAAAEVYRADLRELWALAKRESWRLHDRPNEPAEFIMPTEAECVAVGIWSETASALHKYGLPQVVRVLAKNLKHPSETERQGAASDLAAICLLLRPSLRGALDPAAFAAWRAEIEAAYSHTPSWIEEK